MARVLGISGLYGICDEKSLVVWIGEDGYPTFGPYSRFSAIDPREREAMGRRSRATEADWRAAIKAASDAADQDETKPDVYVILYDPSEAAMLFPRSR